MHNNSRRLPANGWGVGLVSWRPAAASGARGAIGCFMAQLLCCSCEGASILKCSSASTRQPAPAMLAFLCTVAPVPLPPATGQPHPPLPNWQAIDALAANQHAVQRKHYASFYSSELGGIVTDPALMVGRPSPCPNRVCPTCRSCRLEHQRWLTRECTAPACSCIADTAAYRFASLCCRTWCLGCRW